MPPELEDGSEARTYEKFNGRQPRSMLSASLDRGVWVGFGEVTRLDYSSDKLGGSRHEYTHRHGRSVRLYRWGGKTKPPWMWVVTGPKLTVTARGIVH